MADSNHYETLEIQPQATQVEVKQAYRRLVKQFHPDHNPLLEGNHEQMARLNAAYEVLSDPHHRRSYDQQLRDRAFVSISDPASQSQRQRHAAAAQQYYHQQRHTGQDNDEHIEAWLRWVYVPVNQHLREILDPLADQIDQLAADPFDDTLMADFQDYLQNCRDALQEAQSSFRSMPNPPNLAGVAAHLYYCLNQVGDGLDELEFFTLNYDEHYLHTGQELFRIAEGLRWEAAEAIRDLT